MHEKQTSIGKEAAIALFETGWWKSKDERVVAEFCMRTAELCCPFDVFHAAIEKTIGRPVFGHEFVLNFDGIWRELFDGAEPPTFSEILDLIPQDKRIVVAT